MKCRLLASFFYSIFQICFLWKLKYSYPWWVLWTICSLFSFESTTRFVCFSKDPYLNSRYILQTYLNIIHTCFGQFLLPKKSSPNKSQEAYLLAFNNFFVLPKKEKETFIINVLTETNIKQSRIVFQVQKGRYFVRLTF